MLRFLDRSVFRFFGRWTQFLFLIASLIAVIVTLVSFSGIGPIRPASGAMLGLQVINFILIGVLAFYVAQDFFAFSKRRGGVESRNSGSLGRQFAFMFSFAAVAPAILVSLFLGTSLNRGIENWFSERIQTIVEGSSEIARSNLQTIADDLRLDMGIMGLDLNAASVGYETEPDVFTRFLLEQATYREFTGAFLVDSSGNVLIATDPGSRRNYKPPQTEMFQTADDGDVSVTLDDGSSQFRALFKLTEFDDAYLYTSRPIDPRLLNSLVRSEETLTDYRQAEESSRRLQIIFLLGFIQITALILLFFVRFGLHIASEISRPIARLASAADEVKNGHLSVTVPMPKQENEVSELTSSFNAMTEQLREQRDALAQAHKDALERSRFIETVLEGVTAGVVRVDRNLDVTLANPSALRMFPQLVGNEERANLKDAIPAFAGLVEEVLDDSDRREQTLMLDQEGGQKFFILRVAPTLETEPACVLTFDDTSRLISAQRQSAWRDVARRIAHEIRNPLTPIQLSTERLRRRYRKLIDEEDTVFDRCTDTIFRQVSDIGRMVEEFSSFARMPKPDVRKFDLVDSVRNAVFGSRLAMPDVKIRLSCTNDSLIMSGDERLLGQALTNLIKNAGEAIERRANEEEGQDIDKEIQVVVTPSGENIHIEIEDTGPGFPLENRSQFLEPYFTTREQGVGLGLAIVNRIVQDHGGHLTLLDRRDSRIGARVSISLPVAGPSEETVSSWSLSEERV